MVVAEDTNRFAKKHDLVHLAILLAVALGIGMYLIATTVLICKDGVFYIEQAQKLSSDPIGIIKSHPSGYPFLIFMAHKFVTLFSNSLSLHTWIYPAQSITLLCRLVALIPLYFTGKLLIGSKKSFWAILILVILPHPARFGSDVLRAWPHILFLATGFLFLLWGVKQGKWWMFGATGLAAGLGHIIRHECAQLVIYGVLWLLIRLLLPKRNMNRPKLVCALFILLIGFAIPTLPYVKARGAILPENLKEFINPFYQSQSDRIQERDINSHNYTTTTLPSDIVKAFGTLIEGISENLMYFFMPALLIGIYSRFRKQSAAADIERFFVPAFVTFNIIMLTILHYNFGFISRRHCLPLVVLTIFYIPVGLQVIGDWLERSLSTAKDKNNAPVEKQQLWFLVLVIAGSCICLPKLFTPMRTKKQSYWDTAQWLAKNTDKNVLIAVPDPRISFYSGRKGIEYSGQTVPKDTQYIVKIFKNEEDIPAGKEILQVKKLIEGNGKKPEVIVIYRHIH